MHGNRLPGQFSYYQELSIANIDGNFNDWLVPNSNKTQKVCHLSYAKIQGRNNLIRHFKQKGLFEKMAQYVRFTRI